MEDNKVKQARVAGLWEVPGLNSGQLSYCDISKYFTLVGYGRKEVSVSGKIGHNLFRERKIHLLRYRILGGM